jgi:hypothetical protein
MKKILILSLIVLIVSCNKEYLPVPNSGNSNGQVNTNLPVIPRTASLADTTGVFDFLSQSSYPVSGYTTTSRYILYDDSSFVLQYDHNGGFEYRGSYIKVDSLITFNWEGWSTAGPWGAIGTLRGDTLTVSYNTIMALSGFEDAIYLRKP